MATGEKVVVNLQPHSKFVNSGYVQRLTHRALRYLEMGYAVHLSGPSGTGKTTLALHLANSLGRPTVLLLGDSSLESTDLVGGQTGYYHRRVVDNYIHSVMRTEDDFRQTWVDNRLTFACKEGLTLVYDEFNRSRPETNNVLLSILEERILILPGSRGESTYFKVHPDFRAIFTSNPEEYAGVHDTQDALLDRMVTIHINEFDRETELLITRSKSGISSNQAELIVDLVRSLREESSGRVPTVRASIMIAQVVSKYNIPVVPEGEFPDICCDICSSLMRTVVRVDELRETICQILRNITGGAPAGEVATCNASVRG